MSGLSRRLLIDSNAFPLNVNFQDWSGGDAGRSRPVASRSLNTYRGVNTWRYPSGGIGPRPPLLVNSSAGLPVGVPLSTYTPLSVTVNDIIQVSGHFVFTDKRVFRQFGSSAATLTGTCANVIAASAQVGQHVVHVPATVDGGAYSSNNTALVAVAAMPKGQAVAAFGQAVVVLQNTNDADGTSSCIVRFSDPQDITSWPAPNTRFVGFAQRGFGLYNQRNALVIPKETGEIWSFTGVLGATDVLRMADFGRPVRGYGMAQVVNQSNVWWTDGAYVAYFNGSQIGSLLRPDFPPASTDTLQSAATSVDGQIIALDDDDDFVVVGLVPASLGSNFIGGMARRNNAWDRIRFPGLFPTSSYDKLLSGRVSTFSVLQNIGSFPVFVLSPVSGSGQPVRQFGFLQGQEFPYFDFASVLAAGGSSLALAPYVADGDQNPPHPVAAEMLTEEYWAPDGHEVRIQSVVMDFSWQASVAGALGTVPMHQLDISIDVVQPTDQEPLPPGQPIHFVPTRIASAPDGFDAIIRARQVFEFGDQGAGGGFRVRIANWSGIVIHSLHCRGYEEPVRD